jgi:hypothetical protein
VAPCICYAESRDGLHWVKPKLGIHEFNGSRENNIILKTMNVMVGCDNFMVFRDDNPACPPEKKYKAIGVDYTEVNGETTECLNLFYSEDAIHFTFDRILTTDGAFDSLNVCFWDPLVQNTGCISGISIPMRAPPATKICPGRICGIFATWNRRILCIGVSRGFWTLATRRIFPFTPT